MKNFFNICLLMTLLSNGFSFESAIAQSPLAIPYQAVARDVSGNLVASQNTSLRFTLHDVTATGTIVYQETQNMTTNSLGLFSVNIGQGTPISGTLSAVNWSNGAKFLQVELDPNGGTAYTDMGTTQLLSVPYSLHAASSGDNKWLANGNNISSTNSGNVGIGTTAPGDKLSIRNGALSFHNPNDNVPYVGLDYDAATDAMRLRANIGTASLNTTHVTINRTTGYMGIGNILPANKLSVTGNADISGTLGIGTSNTNGFKLNVSGADNAIKINGSGYLQKFGQLNFGDANYVYLKEDEDDKLTIHANRINLDSYVGIGTTAPASNLSVIGNADFSGNVGIGTSTPTNKLTVKGNGVGIVQVSPNNTVAAGIAVYDGGEAYIQTTTYNNLYFTTNLGAPQMTLATYGFVGIGTVSPQAPLHVAGGGILTPTLARAYFSVSSGSSITNNTSSSGNIQVRADGWFWANNGGFVATSDQRIKNKLGATNNQRDLEDLSKIEITDYKYIDEIANGRKVHKKVIAQQLNSVYPLAVDTNKGLIPNVYEEAKHSMVKDEKTIIETSKPHDFKTGDEVKLILEQSGEKIVTVHVIDEHAFSVNEKINDKVFVYGKKVNDLLIVDYDALTTLNISATQALSKQIEELKAENAQLRDEMKQQWRWMEAKLNTLLKEENVVTR